MHITLTLWWFLTEEKCQTNVYISFQPEFFFFLEQFVSGKLTFYYIQDITVTFHKYNEIYNGCFVTNRMNTFKWRL